MFELVNRIHVVFAPLCWSATFFSYSPWLIFSRGYAKLFVRGQIMQMCHSLRCKLLAENMESLGTSFLQTSKVESLWFAFVKVFKAVRGMNYIAVIMYRSQQRSQRGQRIVTSQSQEVASCFCFGLLDVARSFFFLSLG